MVPGGEQGAVVDPSRTAGEAAAVNPHHHRKRPARRPRRRVDVQEQAVLEDAGGRHTGREAAGLRAVMPRFRRRPDPRPRRERLRRPPRVGAGRRGRVGEAEELAGTVLTQPAHQAVVGAHDQRQQPPAAGTGGDPGHRGAGGEPGQCQGQARRRQQAAAGTAERESCSPHGRLHLPVPGPGPSAPTTAAVRLHSAGRMRLWVTSQ